MWQHNWINGCDRWCGLMRRHAQTVGKAMQIRPLFQVATEVLFHGSRLHECQELEVKKSRRGQRNGFWKP